MFEAKAVEKYFLAFAVLAIFWVAVLCADNPAILLACWLAMAGLFVYVDFRKWQKVQEIKQSIKDIKQSIKDIKHNLEALP